MVRGADCLPFRATSITWGRHHAYGGDEDPAYGGESGLDSDACARERDSGSRCRHLREDAGDVRRLDDGCGYERVLCVGARARASPAQAERPPESSAEGRGRTSIEEAA